MIFAARQLQENSREQHQDLYRSHQSLLFSSSGEASETFYRRSAVLHHSSTSSVPLMAASLAVLSTHRKARSVLSSLSQ